MTEQDSLQDILALEDIAKERFFECMGFDPIDYMTEEEKNTYLNLTKGGDQNDLSSM